MEKEQHQALESPLLTTWSLEAALIWTLRGYEGPGQVGLLQVASPHPQESSGGPATPSPIHKTA
ncbi:hypothetical protein PAL_GLEAN10014575 [Pteropus alecto]|uniref:Uncharacterized protein n=1 Tax=Pteropus alecto TaxID=9402 RepID=L5KNQ8_PTEAL|nr:hypothetical protein PAL_GLEAN10014575 [Pteropus alecto]